MARPIKDTPTLAGTDAKRFLKKMQEAEQYKVPSSRLQEIRDARDKFRFVSSHGRKKSK